MGFLQKAGSQFMAPNSWHPGHGPWHPGRPPRVEHDATVSRPACPAMPPMKRERSGARQSSQPPADDGRSGFIANDGCNIHAAAPIASSIKGFEDEVEQSYERPCRGCNGRFKRTYDLNSSIVPRGTSFHLLGGTLLLL